MKLRPWHVGIITLVAILGMAALVTSGDQPGAVVREGDMITLTVSRVEPDATAVFDIALKEGGDAEHESTHIFKVVEVPSIAKAALDTKALTLTVTYDSKAISEGAIRAFLADAGYVAASIEDAVPTTLAADGSSQTIHLVPGDALEPSLFRAKAGVPLTITFSVGAGHLTSVSIPSLSITQDLTTEGATISIPTPVAGTYELICAEGYADATMMVE